MPDNDSVPTAVIRVPGIRRGDADLLPIELRNFPSWLDFLPGGIEQPQLLGMGGFGRVYRAVDMRHESWVAVKVMRQEGALGTGTEQIHWWLREVHAGEILRKAEKASSTDGRPGGCPGLVQVLDNGVVPNDHAAPIYYLVMPLVPGERLDPEKWVDAQSKYTLGCQLAAALDFLHKAGLVHRDLKPGNILVDWATSDATIVDLGLMRSISSDESMEDPRRRSDFVRWERRPDDVYTCTNVVMGTPAYMSPEQARGNALTPASDMFSLGVILWELFGATIRRELSDEKRAESRATHGRDFPCPDISNVADGRLQTLFDSMVAFDPASRPAARAVWTQLGSIAADLPH